ncbi:pyridoxal-dependent decarboxylase [Bacillus thuringiensis]|nr:pyridoxal-dependent decarboxylase [Bacillus thuringiensis]
MPQDRKEEVQNDTYEGKEVMPDNPQYLPRHVQMELPPEFSINPLFARKGESVVPRFHMPDEGMLPETAYQIVHDEMTLDGNARLNLATFVSTWMEPTAEHLYAKSFDKNMIDKDEYPQTAEIEERCVRILANLWHSPAPYNYGRFNNWIVGSLYARGLALKRRWQNARKREVSRWIGLILCLVLLFKSFGKNLRTIGRLNHAM